MTRRGRDLGPKESKKIKTTVIDKTCTKANNIITSQVTLDKKFELEDFFISEEGVINLDVDLLFE